MPFRQLYKLGDSVLCHQIMTDFNIYFICACKETIFFILLKIRRPIKKHFYLDQILILKLFGYIFIL